MSAAVHHITLEEFVARPEREDDHREELIAGELIVSPGAKYWHADIVERLREQLAPLKQRGYRLANDFSCILGGRSMPVPDLAVMLQMRADEAIKNDGWFEGSPELVIEVESPSNRNLQQKAALYLEHGAEQVWIVHRKTRTVMVITLEATIEARSGEILQFHCVSVAVDSIFPQ